VAQKNNIRSIRFSDELAELINRQVGKTFTEKFENLVTRCVWELPQKEQELERLKQEIRQKQQQLQEMKNQVYKLSGTINQLFTKAKALENAIDQETEKWES
jgi:predicted  nucleic acid-binding Zn-ribbon protein